MKNIYYPSSLFHKAIKRNNPKVVYFYRGDFWFHTQKSVIVYTSSNCYWRDVMDEWLKQHKIEVIYENEM